MVSYVGASQWPVAMFSRPGTGHHHHAHHTSPSQNPYFASAYSAASYHHPAAHHPHHHQPPNPAAGVVTSSQFSPGVSTDYNCNHQYHHQFGNMTSDSLAAATAAGWHQPMYSACAAARNMVSGSYDEWTVHGHGHAPPPPPSFYHPQHPSPPNSTPSSPSSSTHGTGNQSPNMYSTTSGPTGFKSEFSPSSYKPEFGSCSGGNSQENASHEIQSQNGVSNVVVSSGGPPTAVSTGTSHSPDSGMAVSDGVSSSGSPATGQHCLGGHHNHAHHLSSTTMLNPAMLGSQHVNLNQQSMLQQHSGSSSSTHTSGISSNGRPAQARSPYEWMKRASHSSVTSNSGGKTRTKDKYRVVYSDTQRLELEKEFHYSRYITIRRKSELASNLGLSERQVKIWFQNRRAKERKVSRKREEMIHREKIATMVHMQNAAVVVANGGMSGGPGMCHQSNGMM